MKQLNSCERTLCRIVSSRALQLRHRKPGEARRQQTATEHCLCYTLCPCWLAPARQKCLHSSSIIGERERAYLVVSTADFSLYIFITGAGRHHTVMFYVILNTRTNVKFHKSSTKLHVSESRLFVMDAAQQSSTRRSFSRTVQLASNLQSSRRK